jgi:hypothetical protein
MAQGRGGDGDACQIFRVLIPTLSAFQLQETEALPTTEAPSKAIDVAAASEERLSETPPDVPATGEEDNDDDIKQESIGPDVEGANAQ